MEKKMLTLTEAQVAKINAQADAVFNSHPTVNELYATVDGNCFFTREKNAAINHARSLGHADLILVTKGVKVEASVEAAGDKKPEAPATKTTEPVAPAEPTAIVKALVDEGKYEEAAKASKTLSAEQLASLDEDTLSGIELGKGV